VLGHPDAAERRIDEQPIGHDAVGDAALLVVEQIGRHDLMVVVGRVGEGAAPVAVAERPNGRNAGAQAFVGHDESAAIEADAGLVETEVVGIGDAPDRKQQIGSFEFVEGGRSRCAQRWRCRAWMAVNRVSGSSRQDFLRFGLEISSSSRGTSAPPDDRHLLPKRRDLREFGPI
jgi:hypothetical protein